MNALRMIRTRLLLATVICTLVPLAMLLFWPDSQTRTEAEHTGNITRAINSDSIGALVLSNSVENPWPTDAPADPITKPTQTDSYNIVDCCMQMEKQYEAWLEDARRLTRSLASEPSLKHEDDGISADAWRDRNSRSTGSLEEMSEQMRKRLMTELESHTTKITATPPEGTVNPAELLSAFVATCELEKSKLAHARTQAIADIVHFREELAEARKSALAELGDAMQHAKARWAKAAAAMRTTIASDNSLTHVDNQLNPADFNRTALQLQQGLDELVAEKERAFFRDWSYWNDSSIKQLQDVKSSNDARGIVRNARESCEKALATSLASMENDRKQRIEELKQFQNREQQRTAMEAREKKLRGRDFQGSARMTDDEFRRVLSDAPDITGLYLEKCTLLTNRSVPEIAKLSDLRILELPSGRSGEESAITADGLRPLRNKKVKQLHLPRSIYDTKEGFEIFASMIGDLTGCVPCNGGHYGGWDMYELSIGDDCLKPLRGVRGLTYLGTPKNVTDVGLEMLAEIPDLSALIITLNRKVTDKGVASLANCRRLKTLILLDDRQSANLQSFSRTNRSGSTVGSNGIQALRNLEFLFLPYHMRTEECFGAFIQALKEKGERWSVFNRDDGLLERISFGNPQSNAAQEGWWPCSKGAIKALAGKKGIRSLMIRDCECDDDSLLGVGNIPDLESITLHSLPRVTGTGLRGLGDAKALRTVSIVNCDRFRDEGLACVGESATLAKLTLMELPGITDAGLMSLENCKKLFDLCVEGTGATAVSKVRLENALPKLNAYFK